MNSNNNSNNCPVMYPSPVVVQPEGITMETLDGVFGTVHSMTENITDTVRETEMARRDYDSSQQKAAIDLAKDAKNVVYVTRDSWGGVSEATVGVLADGELKTIVEKSIREKLEEEYSERFFEHSNKSHKATASLVDAKRNIELLENKVEELRDNLKSESKKVSATNEQFQEIRSNERKLTSELNDLKRENVTLKKGLIQDDMFVTQSRELLVELENMSTSQNSFQSSIENIQRLSNSWIMRLFFGKKKVDSIRKSVVYVSDRTEEKTNRLTVLTNKMRGMQRFVMKTMSDYKQNEYVHSIYDLSRMWGISGC